MTRTSDDFLARLRSRGATHLRRVTFRDNRSTLWSLTRRGRALNLHRAYARAPSDVVDAFAVLARGGNGERAELEKAAERVRSWPPVQAAIRDLRTGGGPGEKAGSRRKGPACAGTPRQQAFLSRAYRHLNQACFAGRLPEELRLRFSRRMRRSLGHLRRLPETGGTSRGVEEIALNLDLLLRGNESVFRDTLLHEMAHAAAWLFDGEGGHGPAWRVWAERSGCQARRCHDGDWAGRSDRRAPVTRVPPDSVFLPDGGGDTDGPG